MTDNILLFSSDCHAAPALDAYPAYLESEWTDEYASYIEWRRAKDVRADDEQQSFIEDDSASTKARKEDFDDRVAYATNLDIRVAALEEDGFVGEVIFPDGTADHEMPFPGTFGDALVYSPDFFYAGLRAYNRWLGETLAPGRQVGLALVPLHDPEYAAQQVRGARALGLQGVIPMWDGMKTPELFADELDPVWAACADEGLPVNIHAGCGLPAGMYPRTNSKGEKNVLGQLVSPFETLYWCRRPLGQFVMGGVLERFRNLHVVFAEMWADWIPRTLEYMEWIWQTRSGSVINSIVPRSPTEYWRRQCHVSSHTTSVREAGLVEQIGVESFTYGTDFPHSGSPWRAQVDFIQESFGSADLSEADLRAVLGQNVARLYDLDLSTLQKIADDVGPAADAVMQPPSSDVRDEMSPYLVTKLDRPLSAM